MVELDFEVGVSHCWCDLGFFGCVIVCDFNLLHSVLAVTRAVLAELGRHNSEANFSFHEIGSCNFNEDVFGIKGNFSGFGIDNWGQGEDLSVLVVENGVLIMSLKNWQELLHLHVGLKKLEKFYSVHSLGLLQGLEHNVFRCDGLVCNGRVTGEFVKIVGAH